MSATAQEDEFISLVVASARIERYVQHIFDRNFPARQKQAMLSLAEAIELDHIFAEEACEAQLAPKLTRMLASCDSADEDMLNCISRLLAALSGSGAYASRLQTVEYPRVGKITFKEGQLGEGVGSRVWKISHRFNLLLVEHPQLVAGMRVLECGSGVGSTGIVAAKLGAELVVLTDFVGEVLTRLAENCCRNSTSAAAAASSSSKPRLQAEGRPADKNGNSLDEAPQFDEFADFEDAESVEELDFADMGSTDAEGSACRRHGQWEFGNMHVRYYDWKEDYDRVKVAALRASGTMGAEDETSSALASLKVTEPHPAPLAAATPAAALAAGRSADSPPASLQGGEACGSPIRQAHGTFDVPSTNFADPPPALPGHETFPVVLGCEVMYEMVHAKWIAAVLTTRLQQGGKAIIAGAIRDRAVFRVFENLLELAGLRFCQQVIAPVAGYSGLGDNEDVYDGGYVMYLIEHDCCRCADWHIDLSSWTWGKPLYPA